MHIIPGRHHMLMHDVLLHSVSVPTQSVTPVISYRAHTRSHACRSVVKGMDVVQLIEKTKVDKNDKPYEDIKILNLTLMDAVTDV